MRHALATSALFALALLTATAAGQPAADPKAKADDKKAAPPKTDSTDAAIAAVLANDPELKVARAKIQLAEAELAKARQTATIKVVTLKAKIDQLKKEAANAQESFDIMERHWKSGTGSKSEFLVEQTRFETARGALAVAEAEWAVLVGPNPAGAGGAATNPTAQDALQMAIWSLSQNQAADRLAVLRSFYAVNREGSAVKGPVPDRLRVLLDKPVKLGPKGSKFTYSQAMEVFKKEVGWDVNVRGNYPRTVVYNPEQPKAGPIANEPIEILSEGEELPVGAWFQLFEDNALTSEPNGTPIRFRFYVRDYGVLIFPTTAAPPDAPTLHDFWKGKPAAAEPKK
jgi:hypothetical protein